MSGVKMKLLVLLVFGWIWSETEAQARTWVVMAPLNFRLDAQETVVLQVFGFTDPVTVEVSLMKTRGDARPIRSQQVTLTANNNHMGEVQLRLYPGDVDNDMTHVVLYVQSASFRGDTRVSLSRTNGFLVVQTDKPLYTPRQEVNVRAFSLNQELTYANRNLFLTFRDPDHSKVAVMEVKDVNNGMPSLQNPFKIPISPKMGIWTLEATYMDHFDTLASTTFEVREYVLPSFTILIEPVYNYVSYNNFKDFRFKVSAKYLHGAPVNSAEVFLRYGFVSGKMNPVIIPSSISLQHLSDTGELDVAVNLEQVFSTHTGPKTLSELKDKFLYITALIQERSGGISEEAEHRSIKFVQSPYKLELISTPLFIKPRLPYTIQVLVKDHLGEPVSGVPLRLRNKQSLRSDGGTDSINCGADTSTTRDEGIGVFYCNIKDKTLSISLQIVTEAANLPSESQASRSLTAETYRSPNDRYLYIDPSPIGAVVGAYTQVKVYSVGAPYLTVKSLNYVIMSKGKVVKFDSMPFVQQLGDTHALRFQVTPEMVPSIRLLVYYMPYGEGVSELVADSVWFNIRGECVSGLEVETSTQETKFQPQQQLSMDVKANRDGYIAMAAVDSAIYSLRPNYKDPIERVLRHLETADQGCGGGGGKDAADVFRLAGLSFMTNANAGQTASSAPCHDIVRSKRSTETLEKILAQYPNPRHKNCCQHGFDTSPTFQTCAEYAKNVLHRRTPECREAFTKCCEHMQKASSDGLIHGRSEFGGNFGKPPSLVRSDFPETWLWQTRNIRGGSLTVNEKLPDSLTTWHIKTVGMFDNGICVAKTLKVSVDLPLSVNVPLPYQLVRGEQIELEGSVYNQLSNPVQYCVTLSVVPELCLVDSQPATDGSNHRSTACDLKDLASGEVGKVSFIVMALEAGQHQLNFSLSAAVVRRRNPDPLKVWDKVVKTLTVVPEGRLYEDLMGGLLDPKALYGSSKKEVVLRSAVPKNIVPKTEIQRTLTVTGEILDKWVSVMEDPKALDKLLSLQNGNAKSDLSEVRLVYHVYKYLESTGRNTQKAKLQDRIRLGMAGVSMFKRKDFSYSMFKNQEPSTWLTALIVQTLAKVDNVINVDRDSLAESVEWLIKNAQNADGSFRDNSRYKPNSIMKPDNSVDKSVYLTSFVIIALHEATKIDFKKLRLKSQENSIQAAMKYVDNNIDAVEKVYPLSVAAYALTLHDPTGSTVNRLLTKLEDKARNKGSPLNMRYWTDFEDQTEWLKPDQSSGQTVETTVYALLSFLHKGRISYCNNIMTWLTQDQHYGGGLFGLEDTLMTLEAVAVYSEKKTNEELDQGIVITADRDTRFYHRVRVNARSPVSSPITLPGNTAVILRTGNSDGVSEVTLKTVYYQTVPPQDKCNFNIKLEIFKEGSQERNLRSPYLIACAQYKPPSDYPDAEESELTVMEIELPTGIEPILDDLRPLMGDPDIVASYRQNGRTVIININSVPVDRLLCVGFRIRKAFRVGGTSDTTFTVYEDQDRGSKCSQQVSDQVQKLHRLCQGDQCQCMTVTCSTFRGTLDSALIHRDNVLREICPSQVKYAFKVIVTNITLEGDFSTVTATVADVVKRHAEFKAVDIDTEVEFVKKTTCESVDLKMGQQYLIFGVTGLEVVNKEHYKYRFPLDSETVIQIWPIDCTDECKELTIASITIQSDFCP